MAKSCVPSCDLVKRDIKQSVPCKGCEERELGCHGKCEKYKVYRETLMADRKKRIEVYAPEQMYENYCRKIREKIVKRMRTERR